LAKKPYLQRDRLAGYKPRIHGFRENDVPGWGKMNALQAAVHLRRAIEVSLGEVAVQDHSTWMSRKVMKKVFFDILSKWPKGITNDNAALYHPDPTGDLRAEKIVLLAAMERFAEAVEREPAKMTMSEKFGPTSLDEWRLMHGRHLEHHLRQFGL
jgi:oxepin-CoA hydrolase / 3-oxo-5,6-dehydrosuberyl-CoA semialdehyde dehydrogenase